MTRSTFLEFRSKCVLVRGGIPMCIDCWSDDVNKVLEFFIIGATDFHSHCKCRDDYNK